MDEIRETAKMEDVGNRPIAGSSIRIRSLTARYRCSKGHEWTGEVFLHPFFRVVGKANNGKVIIAESDPCPFCYAEFFNTLPQAEEVKDA